jgi:decaprenylphospho-beta-D-erythro-pentofuranosid-2-ulose 2-reductase
MRKILIVGATSAIAEATARLFATRGDALYLVGRKAAFLQSIAADLKVRSGRDVGVEVLDANDITAHEAMLKRASDFLGGLDTVLIAYGTLSDQKACEGSAELTVHELTNNGVSTVALLVPIAEAFERQKKGSIAVISSVAGDRGRQSNYTYGSAKALVSTFMSGLRQRLAKAGVAVITIKPGFVDTPMTAAFPKGPLWAKPEKVAAGIVKAIDTSASVVYLPSFWWAIMLIIRSIPERIFVKLKL